MQYLGIMFAKLGIKTRTLLIFISSLYLIQFVSLNRALQPCPNNCVCSSLQDSLSEAKCSQFPLLEELDDYLHILRIESTEICPISKDLQRFTQLKSLSVSNCAVDVNVNNFKNLVELQNVTFYNTSITNFDPSLFKFNQNLKLLNLSSNPLKIWRHVLISTSVEEIDLSNCNLKVIPRNAFSKILNLKRLILKSNELKLMNNILPTSITFLDLSDNYMEAVSFRALRTLINLNEIDISGNPLICSCKLKLIEKYLSLKNISFVKPLSCVDKGKENVPLDSISLKYVCKLRDDWNENSTVAKFFKRLRRSPDEEYDNAEGSQSETNDAELINSTNKNFESSSEILNTQESKMQVGDGENEQINSENNIQVEGIGPSSPTNDSYDSSPGNDHIINNAKKGDSPITLRGIIWILGGIIVVLILLLVGIIAALIMKLKSGDSNENSSAADICAMNACEQTAGADNGGECSIPMISRRSSTRKGTFCRICPSTISSRRSCRCCEYNRRRVSECDAETVANECQFDCSNLTSACTTFDRSGRC